MNFFKSDIVRSEMAEIAELQQSVYNNVFKFHLMDREEKISHVNLLEKLLDKQRTIYTRLSLSDAPEAKEMKSRISESASSMGLPSGVDMNVIFGNLAKMLDKMKDQIDRTGFDL